MLKGVAVIYGIIFVIMGILGFIPSLAPNDMLFHAFYVNALHNIVHVFTGLIAFWVAGKTLKACQLFFRFLGIFYAILAILGFIYGDQLVLNLIANNMADSWLHLVIAIVSLYLGFSYKIPKSAK